MLPMDVEITNFKEESKREERENQRRASLFSKPLLFIFTGFDKEVDAFTENLCNTLYPIFDVHSYSHEYYYNNKQPEHLLCHMKNRLSPSVLYYICGIKHGGLLVSKYLQQKEFVKKFGHPAGCILIKWPFDFKSIHNNKKRRGKEFLFDIDIASSEYELSLRNLNSNISLLILIDDDLFRNSKLQIIHELICIQNSHLLYGIIPSSPRLESEIKRSEVVKDSILWWCQCEATQSIETRKIFQSFSEGDVPGELIRSINLLPLITNQEEARLRSTAADLSA